MSAVLNSFTLLPLIRIKSCVNTNHFGQQKCEPDKERLRRVNKCTGRILSAFFSNMPLFLTLGGIHGHCNPAPALIRCSTAPPPDVRRTYEPAYPNVQESHT
jgi:hypothetical protein